MTGPFSETSDAKHLKLRALWSSIGQKEHTEGMAAAVTYLGAVLFRFISLATSPKLPAAQCERRLDAVKKTLESGPAPAVMAVSLNAIQRLGNNPKGFSLLYGFCRQEFLRDLPEEQRMALIIPTFNRDTRLKASVSALLGYDLKFLDVYIFDNASTDGTPAACRELADHSSNTNVIIHRNTANIGWLRNYLFALAYQKDCVGYILGADDDLYPEILIVYSFWSFLRNPDLGLIRFDPNGPRRKAYPNSGIIVGQPFSRSSCFILGSINSFGGISLSSAAFRESCANFPAEKNLLGHISLAMSILSRQASWAVSGKEYDPRINAYAQMETSTGTKINQDPLELVKRIDEGSLDSSLYLQGFNRQAILVAIYSLASKVVPTTDVGIARPYTGYMMNWWNGWIGPKLRDLGTSPTGCQLLLQITRRMMTPSAVASLAFWRDISIAYDNLGSDVMSQIPGLALVNKSLANMMFHVIHVKLKLSREYKQNPTRFSLFVLQEGARLLQKGSNFEELSTQVLEELTLVNYLSMFIDTPMLQGPAHGQIVEKATHGCLLSLFDELSKALLSNSLPNLELAYANSSLFIDGAALNEDSDYSSSMRSINSQLPGVRRALARTIDQYTNQ
ncbi:glycosyltransferase [Cyanobium sp. NIES-981]|uniref:glycosyltransferase n=1 Tax=Cyanobium sp. NIES-981 TaxID=1851505 RepID=UPI0012FA8DDB|nr:glycosyltransferase [Cyanobium sp. NIES-981]